MKEETCTIERVSATRTHKVHSASVVPLIIVEGFLSATGSVAWPPLRKYVGGYENLLGDRKVMIARCVLVLSRLPSLVLNLACSRCAIHHLAWVL